MNHRINPVTADWIDFFWELIEHFLVPVIDCSGDEITLDSVKEHLKAGNGQLVLILSPNGTEIVAATVLSIKCYDSGLKALYIPIMGGTGIQEWGEQFLEFCRETGRQYGCDELRTSGRRGWVRLMQSYGWEEVSTIVRQKLWADHSD